ncbi:DUF1700 domain-containing protein [Konateibacter massiliensis]|uniref:DUF1700 domain-containing protein n=1 Tax=Konateibacter massiliensis TaxID=2002841 RepID=UPI000C1603E2|nr:DUF1700 domain-containing protein [Konateibacter massiliensis]
MDKYDFLNKLREALEGEVSQSIIEENISYYSTYIDSEIRKGKSEAEVLQLLGEPRLIAKTIIDTNGSASTGRTYTYSNEAAGESQENNAQGGFHASYNEQGGVDFKYGKFKINTWYVKMALIILVIAILCIVGRIALAILPIIFPIVVIFALVSYFTGNRR